MIFLNLYTKSPKNYGLEVFSDLHDIFQSIQSATIKFGTLIFWKINHEKYNEESKTKTRHIERVAW